MTDLLTTSDLLHVEEAFWLLEKKTSNPAYDFDLSSNFACRRPWERPISITAIARLGAFEDYDAEYESLSAQQIVLANTPQQHRNGSELPDWYPLLSELTPKSVWFATPPAVEIVEQRFRWPIFVKGSRQTSRHDPRKSIARNRDEYAEVIAAYRQDPILRWQQFVVREFVTLRPVPCTATIKIAPSFEFRTFWWRKQCVGFGPYWSAFADYAATESERAATLAVAQTTADRVDCPFLVVDVAQTNTGRWIVIECNDAQESGYAGVSPFEVWQKIARIEKQI
jgi:hypothetical protein